MKKISKESDKQTIRRLTETIEQQAKAGFVDFQFALGKHYFQGTSFESGNDESAFHWLQKAFVGGCDEARQFISIIIGTLLTFYV